MMNSLPGKIWGADEDDPGLNHDENDDLSLNIEEDDEDELY